MPNVEIKPGVVATRGSGMPDYSRQAVGSQQTAVSQQVSGAIAVASVSGDTVYIQPITDFFSPVDGVSNLRQLQSSGGRIRNEEFPFTFNGTSWDRLRSVSGAWVSGSQGAAGVVAVGLGPAVVSGQDSRVEHGYVLSGGDTVVSTPASGRALQVRDLHDSYMGTSGLVPVAYRFGQGAGPMYDHQVGAAAPNWDKALVGETLQGPKRTASGIGDLVINVGIPSTSGVSYTAIVQEI